ncbi:MAG: hypothetical protein K2Q22_10955, partial [Cytophagales bacterium]|nr:hypothetical protein [Cytophagales bacterium]
MKYIFYVSILAIFVQASIAQVVPYEDFRWSEKTNYKDESEVTLFYSSRDSMIVYNANFSSKGKKVDFYKKSSFELI